MTDHRVKGFLCGSWHKWMAQDRNRSAPWIPTTLVCHKKKTFNILKRSLCCSHLFPWFSLCVANKWSMLLKGTRLSLSLSRICPHLTWTSSLSVTSLSSLYPQSHILSFYFQTLSLSISTSLSLKRISPFFLPLLYKDTQTYSDTHGNMHTLCWWSAIPVRETGCSHGNGLAEYLYSWHTHTQIQWHKHAGTPTLFPHQRNCANPKIKTMERKGKGGDSLIYSYLSVVQVHSVHGQFLGIF